MKLMILDGNSVINRAFYGVHGLTTREGLYTNAIYGFLNIMQRMENEEKPDALCVAFDLHGPTFRHLRYDGYKATRHGMPDELAQQMPVMKDVLRAMNIPIYECQGWEADDVIGTVGKKCGESGWDCVIVTGDRDSLQLIDKNVKVKLLITKPGQTAATLYDEAVFRDEYGFDPIHLIDLKALMGDSSDNIPGVAGVGPKTAKDLLLKYGTLDGVYENLTPENMKGKLFDKLTKSRENAYLSYELATIVCEAPIDFKPEDALRREPQKKALYDLFLKLEFVKLIDKYNLRGAAFEEDAPTETFAGTVTVTQIRTQAEAEKFLANAAGKELAIALSEDFSLLAADDGEGMTVFDRADLQDGFDDLLKALFSGKYQLLVHGAKALQRKLLERGLSIDGIVFDTEVAAYLLDAARGKYELEMLTADYLHYTLPEDCELMVRLQSEATSVRALRDELLPKLQAQGMEKLFYDIDLPLCRVLAGMEAEGVSIDADALHRFGEMLGERIASCETLIFGYAGEEFNINSTKQLGELLFEKLGLPPVKKTKSGYSTNADVLKKLKYQHPVVQAIMDYRMLTKLKSTYADGLEKVICEDGRIRTTFQNTVTATGRLSSTEPNLQNIPVRTELGSEIRRMFIAKPGCVLVDADYSQIELRVLAHAADDKNMQAAFNSGEDFHTVTAAQVFGVPVESVTPQMRRSAKAVNFGVVYGISEFSLAEDIGVSRYEAKQFIEDYLTRFSGVDAYMKKTVADAKANGYTETLYGRRRPLPDINNSKYLVRSAAERMAMNAPIQGAAADIIKIAMIRVAKALEKAELQAKLILQVHDELIVECPAFEAPLVMQILAEEMQAAATLKVPLIAEAKMGDNWYEAK